MKATVFWVAAPCRLVADYWRSRDVYCLHYQDTIVLTINTSSTSETSVNSYQTTRRNNPTDSRVNGKPSARCLPLMSVTWAQFNKLFLCILTENTRGNGIAQSVQWLGYGRDDRGYTLQGRILLGTTSRPLVVAHPASCQGGTAFYCRG
jgi:hypothetical protein